MRGIVLLAIIVLGGTAGDLCVSRAMKHIGEVKNFTPRHLLGVMLRSFRVGWMWLGLALMTVAFFSLLAILSWENVSFVVPATALSYAVGALGARFLLGERVSAKRWSGVLLVCFGVALVWLG